MEDDCERDLAKLRTKIDEADYEFLKKFSEIWKGYQNERLEIVRQIGELKKKAEVTVTDKRREQQVISDRANRGHNLTGIPRKIFEEMWKWIIARAKENE